VGSLLIIFLVFRIGVTVGYWKLFEKAGIEGWKSLIPLYSEYVIATEIVGKPKWWIIYLLIPLVNLFAYFILIFDLLRCFGKDSLGAQILTLFAGFLYLPYVSFKSEVTYLGKLDQLPERKKTAVQEWTDAIVFAVVAATLIRWLIMEAYTIPTPSMENSLLVGDFLFVSKFHYGTRTTSTPLQIPLTHQKIWFTDVPSYVEWIKLPQYRLPGITEIKREDVVVFNVPGIEENNFEEYDRSKWIDYPVDLKTNYIKRCVAIPGDTLVIRDREIYASGVHLNNPPQMQYTYSIIAKDRISERNLNHYGIEENDIDKNNTGTLPDNTFLYTVSISDEKYKLLMSEKPSYIISVKLNDRSGGELFPYFNNPDLNAGKSRSDWSLDNFGPLWVPKKGATIPINDSTLVVYGNTIKKYDLNDNVEIKNGKLLIDGTEVTEYTFKQDYYFMMGDNRHNSLDSRYWGFVPADHIVGKAFFIWLSLDKDGGFADKIRWSRFFKLIR
jgi:signal peptidase I